MTLVRTPLIAVAALVAVTLLASCSAPVAVETEAPADDSRSEVAVALPEPTAEAESSSASEGTDDGVLQEGYSYVADDTDVLTVVVPDDWEVDGRPFESTDGAEWAGILASPDLENFFTDWTVAGIDFSGIETGGEVDEEIMLGFLTDISAPFAEDCETDHEAADYFDGTYTGFVSTYTDCGGEGVYGINIVAQDPDFAHFIYLNGKFVTAEDQDYTLDIIVTTFLSTQGVDSSDRRPRKAAPAAPAAPAPMM